ncbi:MULTISPECIES: type II CAAX endopeptidase family protein [unclassified Oceanobacillus]|uniref:CPBP family intramembrane glutamic endopeptidase n=1 Tax=unclassified Oceanobacillus TaxID=2630292 RepID=UPI001BEA4F9F|nr:MULTISPECIES: type II CAAX endopeptidase family protein [unclassified Oceanobacillus]MBT2600070.1 CPBP family intramembrane metalloprotease [Oceanobacillus sp. ISL-74]MBT2652482.1 CPBP family intramembrane metalloprotease [Oceanobacillus sp. ISL-73]
MKIEKSYFNQSAWSWKELILLLTLVLVLIPFFIEYLLMQYLTEIFQNELYSGTLIGLIMSIIFTLGVYFIAIRPKNLSWKEVGFQRFSKSYWGPIIGWTLVLINGSILLIYFMELVLDTGTDNSKTDSLQTRLTTMNIVIAFVSAAIISPIYEEIFYRGFLYRWIRTKYGLLAGMLISSFIFMLVHIPTFNSLPYTFLSGLIFAWTYEKTQSIYPAMIIHALFNGLAILLTATA